MAANQLSALSINPNHLDMTILGHYERLIDASVERVWENVRDWEHLPWLHANSFDFISLQDEGDWGWRVSSDKAGKSHIELCIDEANLRYVARTYKQKAQISEIWTSLNPVEAQTNILVTFMAPDIAPAQRMKIAELYQGIYQVLWDEDEEMMQARSYQLSGDNQAPEILDLGAVDALKANLPSRIQLGRHSFWLREEGEKIVAVSATCPHLLGPLDDFDAQEKTVTCPWHGYRFDTTTGACIYPESAKCQLRQPPQLTSDPVTGHLIASLRNHPARP